MVSIFTQKNLAEARKHTQRDAEEKKQQIDEAKQRDALAWRERMVPVQTRVERFLETVPDAVKAAGLSMQLFKENMKGRYRGQVNTPDVGKALRALGWIRVRKWRDENHGFSALWFPPVSIEAHPRRAVTITQKGSDQ